MDEIMDSSRIRRNRKIEEKMKELENEIELLRVNTMKVLKKCWETVGTVEGIESHEHFLKAYTSVYSRLGKYTTFYSDVNCKLEVLLIETEKEKFDIKVPHGPASEGFEETDSLEFRETLEDFRAIAILRNSEKVGELPSNSQVDLYQRNNKVIEINENKLELSSFGPVSKKNNNNLSSETGNINVSQVDINVSSNAPKNYHPKFSNSGNNSEGIFQYSEPLVPENVIFSTKPFIDTPFWLRTSVPQYLHFQGLSSSVSLPAFYNSTLFPRIVESSENGKFDLKEGNSGSETNYKDHLKPLNIDRKVGSFHNIILSNLVSPDEFYAQMQNVDFNVMIMNMTEEIEKLVESGSVKSRNYHDKSLSFRDKKYLASVELKGGYALGYFKDQWSRLEILDWRINVQDDFVNVFFLDSGQKELISLENLQPMDEVLMKYPLLVQKFYLPFILPRDKEWSQKDITIFEILTEMAELKFHLKVEITESDPNRKDFALGVNLLVPEFGINVNQKLVEYGVAVEKICTSNENYYFR